MRTPVTMIGLGPMGQAMVRAFLAIVGAVAAARQDTALPAAVKSRYDRMIAAGYGKNSWTRMIDVVRSD